MARRRRVITVDLADVWAAPDRKRLVKTVAWGDEVTVVDETSGHVEIEFNRTVIAPDGSVTSRAESGYIVPRRSASVAASDCVGLRKDHRVLRVNFIDVQQGDAAVLETPDGKLVLIDGGENQLFARYLAARFPGTSDTKPLPVDAIVVTHGDADHFSGLTEIHDSESLPDEKKAKRLFIRPDRVFHNGIVKRPSSVDGRSVPDRELLGPTVSNDRGVFLTGLVDDLRTVADTDMNREFRAWRDALVAWTDRQGDSDLEMRALQFGDDDAFAWIDESELRVEVLGPFRSRVGRTTGLRFLGTPPDGPRIGHDVVDPLPAEFGGLSASHTINGHSIILRITFGGFTYLFTGDLNEEAGRTLASKHYANELSLMTDVFKVPHHGSADFSGAFLQAAAPIVSVVSSGDESVAKEYIHPRATLMGALGRYSRTEEPLVLVTELIAFFRLEGTSELTDQAKARKRGEFFAFSRAAFGAVKTRTDGQRLLVYTDSANVKLKEAYAYELDEHGAPTPSAVTRV